MVCADDRAVDGKICLGRPDASSAQTRIWWLVLLFQSRTLHDRLVEATVTMSVAWMGGGVALLESLWGAKFAFARLSNVLVLGAGAGLRAGAGHCGPDVSVHSENV